MAVAPVAHEVDEDVGPERLPIAGGQPRGLHGRLGIVAVDVENGRAQHLRRV